jgi:hypothetical protein
MRKTNLQISTGLSDWCRIIIKGADTTSLSLGRPLNTSGENQDFFVSSDESFMIVTNRPELGISYKKSDGSWTNPRNFGPEINFGLGSWGPWVTPDNKYLFYTTGTKPDYSDVYVYWVRVDGAIDSLEHTNLSPYIKSLIPNQTAVAGQPFTFTVPDNIFFDDDSNVPLTYSTVLINGNPLPSWISFNPGTRTFSGTPAETGDLTIRIVVIDSEKATAFWPSKFHFRTFFSSWYFIDNDCICTAGNVLNINRIYIYREGDNVDIVRLTNVHIERRYLYCSLFFFSKK